MMSSGIFGWVISNPVISNDKWKRGTAGVPCGEQNLFEKSDAKKRKKKKAQKQARKKQRGK